MPRQDRQENRKICGRELSYDMNKEQKNSGQVAQLIRASSQYAKVMGLIPGKGTYKKQPMNA